MAKKRLRVGNIVGMQRTFSWTFPPKWGKVGVAESWEQKVRKSAEKMRISAEKMR